MNETPPEGRFDFPNEELRILKYWDEIDAFKTSLKLSEGRPLYTFLDGPPFATGLPHYGHLLAGTIKDTVTRYAAQTGYHVERRFGWDCHGLPIEYEIDKKLNIKSKDDVMKMGVAAYNAECRAIVMRYSGEWQETVRRSARWIDFTNDYKTMYPSFMESVWWVFQQLFDKGQIYRGFRVMPYSTACNTPLSNFEVALNYKEDTQDPAVTVELPLIDDPNTVLLIWTTTPWTLPSNLAVCVNPEMQYVYAQSPKNGKIYVIAATLVAAVMHSAGHDGYTVIKTVAGTELEGLRYEPMFEFFAGRIANYSRTFTVVVDSYVTSDTGTGLVHLAPAFGEDDFNVCLRYGITKETDVPCPIDDGGRFTAAVPRFVGQYWRDANPGIIKELDHQHRLFHRTQITHSYPFCWRSDTPLIYRAIPCWFVRVANIIPQLLEASQESYWVPEFVQDKRFHNWLAGARDWAISRNRYWGTPIPIWASEDFEEVVCIGSVQQLEALSGVSGIKDLHRESIDHITIPSKQGKGTLRRVEEVLDCWFESGSVPYAQNHYPFEQKDRFENSFPADFIGEGLDQTRGWFYTLTVLGVHLFGKVPFKNLIVNGLVLAADGKKMSKRLKNYPEPRLMFDNYGADALRLYLINSPVVRAEPLRFREDGVHNIIRDVLLPWYNSYRFLAAQLEIFEAETGHAFMFDPLATHPRENTMDAWILASFQSLIQTVRSEMAAYKLYAVVPPLLKFIESLTNWYIRLNRRRLKGDAGAEEMHVAIRVLFDVVYNFSLVMAPFTPLFAENLHLRLAGHVRYPASVVDSRSVHFLEYPKVRSEYFNLDIERAFSRLQQVVERGRTLREANNITLKTPLAKVTVLSGDASFRADLDSLRVYIEDELNVRCLTLSDDEAAWGVKYVVKPNFKILGQRLKKDLGVVQKALTNLDGEQLHALLEEKSIVIAGYEITSEEVEVVRDIDSSDASLAIACEAAFVIILDKTMNEDLRDEGLARELVNRVQRLRKKAGLKATDEVQVICRVKKDNEGLKAAWERQMDYLGRALKGTLQLADSAPDTAYPSVVVEDEVEIGESTVYLAWVKIGLTIVDWWMEGNVMNRQEETNRGVEGESRISLTIASLNCWGLWWSKKRKLRFDLIADYFSGPNAGTKVDFITLQEVWMEKDYEKVAAVLATTHPYRVRFPRGVIGSGLAIFSRHPITHSFYRKFTLNGAPDRFWHGDFYSGKGIGGIRVKVSVPGSSEEGVTVDVYTTHLHAEYDKKNQTYLAHRLTQLCELGQFVESTSRPEHVVLVTGDLNTMSFELPHRLVLQAGCANRLDAPLRDAWGVVAGRRETDACLGASPTASVDAMAVADERGGATFARAENTFARKKKKKSQRIDYILYAPHEGVICEDMTVVEDMAQGKVSMSDHSLLQARFSVQPRLLHAPRPRKPEGVPLVPLSEAIELVQEATQVLESKKKSVETWQKLYTILAIVMLIVFVAITIVTAVTIPNDQLTPLLILALFGTQPAVLVTLFMGVFMARLFLQEERTALDHFLGEWRLWLLQHEAIEVAHGPPEETVVLQID